MIEKLLSIALVVPLFSLAVPASRQEAHDAPASPGPVVDFRSIERFLEVTGVLLEDREPSEGQWRALFGTPGHSILASREPRFSRSYLEDRFRLVFKPSERELLESRLAALEAQRPSAELQRLRHYCEVRDAREGLLRRIEQLKESALFHEATQVAAGFLPPGAVEGNPRFCLLIFEPDARGYSSLLVDLVHLDLCTDPLNLLAHELHHYYLDRSSKVDLDDLDAPDIELLRIMDQIHKEGIADQIDKPGLYYGERVHPRDEQRAVRYRRLVGETPMLIPELDRILVEIAEDPESRWANGARFADLVPDSGHPTGYYMATMILEEMGRETLLAVAGNPPAFFRTFNTAAERSNPEEVRFSEEAMSVIEALEHKYAGVARDWETIVPRAPEPGIDLSGAQRFFSIASILAEDGEPAEEDWNALFATHGYHALSTGTERHLFSQEYYFKKYFRLIFKPSEAARLEAELEGLRRLRSVPRNAHRMREGHVRHLCAVRDAMDELEAFSEALGDPRTSARAMQILAGMLPAASLRGDPGICLLFFGADYRRRDPVLLDVLYGRQLNPRPERLVARWYGHYFLECALPYDPESVEEKHGVLLERMAGVYTEGLLCGIEADAYLDEEPRPEERERIERFRSRYRRTPEVIGELRGILARMAGDNSKVGALGSEFARAIPGLGGPTGLYMSRAIVEVLGREALVELAGDPLAFFRVYDEAAAASGGVYPRLGEEGVEVIRRLEGKYVLD